MSIVMPKMTTRRRLWRGNPLAVGAIALSGREVRRREKAKARRAAKKQSRAEQPCEKDDAPADGANEDVASVASAAMN